MGRLVYWSHRSHLIAILAIGLVGIIIYSNTFNAPFVFDDFHNIRENPHVRLTHLDLKKLYNAAFKSNASNRPLANISFALNYYFGKYDERGYHGVNVLIHLINGVLVYLLALTLLRQRFLRAGPDTGLSIPNRPSPDVRIGSMALFSALFFLAHPIQTQSVTYIVQRMNSMAALFYLLSMLLYIYGRLCQKTGKRRLLWTGCTVSWILALGSKEIAATLPFILVLYEWYFFQHLGKAWIRRHLPYLMGLVLILFAVTWLYLGRNPFENLLRSYAVRDFTMGERVLTQFRVILIYMGLILFPTPSRLNLLHQINASRSLFDPMTTFFSLLIIATLLFLAVCMARKKRLISFCILWFFIQLSIESSVIALEMIFEHRLYLPMVGVSVLAAYPLLVLSSKKPWWAFLIALVIVLSLAMATYSRNRVWTDRIALWSDVVSKSPQSYRAQYNLGSDLGREGKHKEAIDHLSQALRIKPDYPRAYNNLGVALDEQGRLDEAMAYYMEALRINPDYAEAHHNLGLALERQGKFNEAIDHYVRAIEINPDFAESHNNLGILLERENRLQEAVAQYREALRINPEYAEAHNNLAVVLEKTGQVKEAIHHYFEALRWDPNYLRAYSNLGVALTRQGLLKEAIQCYTEALRINPGDPTVHNNLGAALADQGKGEEAIARYREALRIRPDYAEAHNNLGIALTRQGNVEEAIGHFSEALRINPDDPVARRNLDLARGVVNKRDAR